MNKTIVITGGSRGIGLGLTRTYLEQEHNVITTTTDPLSAHHLLELKENYPDQLDILKFEANDSHSPSQLATEIGELTSHVDILINNAGVYKASVNNVEEDQSSEFLDLNFDAVDKVLRINTISPLILTKELAFLLKKSTDSKVINISSGMGSISEFSWPDHISYCVSKSGLNMVTKALSDIFRNDGIPVVSVSPGWVRTDMGGPNADLSVEESIADLIPFIESVNLSMSGGFFRKSGDPIPW